MSTYYEYSFVSPEPVYARIKEELSSYFATDMVDDLLFPVWTSKALRSLARTVMPIVDTVLYLDDFTALLPRGFDSVREAWLCSTLAPVSIRKPGAFYSQVITLLNPEVDPCKDCDPCTPQSMELIYKATTDELFTTKTSHLLQPGNIAATQQCGVGCPNVRAESADKFDIKDGRFHTSFRTGDVYLKYYSKELDEHNYQLIPDNEDIENYIEAYIKCKLFEQLWNQVTDETYNQMREKYQVYEQKKIEAFATADVEMKKQTVYQKKQAMIRQNNRFNKYRIR